MKDWYRKHNSAIFIFALILISIIFLFTGLNIEKSNNSSIKMVGIVFVQLSGTSLAAAIGSIFLQMRDIREYFSYFFVDMLSTGDFVERLTNDAKKKYMKRIILAINSDKIKFIEKDLFDVLSSIVDHSLTGSIYYNYNYICTIRDIEGEDDFVECNDSMTYKVKNYHLKTLKYEVKHQFEVLIRNGEKKDKYIDKFDIRIGYESFNKDSLIIEDIPSKDNITRKLVTFSREIDIENEIDIACSFTYLKDKCDNVIALYTRYASLGFSVTVIYNKEYDYHTAWYTNWNPCNNMMPESYLEKVFPTGGIKTATNDWLLPGEGVIICYTKKTIANTVCKTFGG